MKRTVVIACLLFLSPVLANASALQALVVEVRDGNTLVAVNVNRTLNIRLKASDAPELKQAYGDVARQHLSDLVLNQQVSIEISGVGKDGFFIGRVYRDEMDVCQQMIRDGVAWYDKNYDSELSELERRLFAESEQAARDERRGIWQDASPLPPWAFRKAEAARQVAGANSTSNTPQQTASDASRRTGRSLTSEDIHQRARGGAATPALRTEGGPQSDAASQPVMEYMRSGSQLYLQHDFNGAIEPYSKALELEKRKPTLNRTFWRVLVDNLGMSYGITGDLKHAKETFEYGLSKDPTYPMFHYNMACTYAEMNALDKAIEYLKRAFSYRANMIPGEVMPNPATDSSFARFLDNEKFINALRELR
jgi:endonuclease YncB( thermonuclease family)